MRVHLCPQNLLVLNQWLGRDGLGPGGLQSFGIPGRPKSEFHTTGPRWAPVSH